MKGSNWIPRDPRDPYGLLKGNFWNQGGGLIRSLRGDPVACQAPVRNFIYEGAFTCSFSWAGVSFVRPPGRAFLPCSPFFWPAQCGRRPAGNVDASKCSTILEPAAMPEADTVGSADTGLKLLYRRSAKAAARGGSRTAEKAFQEV